MKISLMMSICAAIILLPSSTQGQDRWAAELGAGPAFATDDLGDAALGTGFGFEGVLAYRMLPHLWLYGGWDWHRFPEDVTDGGVDFEETGYAYGLRFEHPFVGEQGGPSILVRAGGTYAHIEVEDAGGDPVADSGHGVGWEVGVHAVLPFAGPWRVTPGSRYRALSRDLDVGDVPAPVDLTYIALEIAVLRTF